MALNYLANLSHYLPEIVMCIVMIGLIFVESSYERNFKGPKSLFNLTAAIGLITTFVVLIYQLDDSALFIFTKSLVIDSFGTLAKMIMVMGTLGCLYLSTTSSDIYSELKSEYTILAVGVLIGGMLLVSANNLLVLYIAIETLSILSYVMASLKRENDKSTEAGLKYSLYGGVTAGMMLFGMSHIFGVLGTIEYTSMMAALKTVSSTELLILLPSMVMFLVGIGYKIACVPFHMWSPDVYEGSPVPVTTFFALIPKIAGMVALVRISMSIFSTETIIQHSWIGLLSIIAALTMTVGNVAAIGQKSVKRMLAYSSISHAGMMMMGVVVLSEVGNRSILFYSITYVFMTLVAFFITSFVQDKYGNDHFERFDGLMTRYPFMAIAMALTMFSLAGLPPLSGFVAKLNILMALIEKKYIVLAIIAALNSVVSLYYYLKIVRFMIFKKQESDESIAHFGFKNQFIVIALSMPVLFLGLFWETVMSLAASAKIYLQ